MPSLAIVAAFCCGMPTRLATDGSCAAASKSRCCAGVQGMMGADAALLTEDLQIDPKGFYIKGNVKTGASSISVSILHTTCIAHGYAYALLMQYVRTAFV